MIPDFNDDGYLPPGIHAATLDEVEERFGRESEIRQAEMQSLRWLVDAARTHRASRLIIDGSFVTDRLEPNDLDCVVLFPEDFLVNAEAREAFESGFPFLDVSAVDQFDFDYLVHKLFATDRHYVPKGTVEVIL